jgi:maltose O-acetyltransferase
VSKSPFLKLRSNKRMISMIQKLKEFLFWKLRGEVPLSSYIERGLKVGKDFSMEPGCYLDYSHCWLIEIGDFVTLAPRVQVLAHDASTKRALGYAKIGRVSIGSRVFIGAGSIILPNVRIGSDVIIAAGAVVTKDVPDNSIVGGNPGKVIGTTDEYMNKNKELMKSRPVYDEEYTVRLNIDQDKKEKMNKELIDGIGFVK